jgi:predicted TIM-barrel fold metal-dependent hydrolase
MTASVENQARSRQIRAELGHPVIDVDGHMIEFFPVIFEYVKRVGGAAMVDRMRERFQRQNSRNWYNMSVSERRRYNQIRPAFWPSPAENTLDRATAMRPRLMRERLPELGIDYAVVYPTIGFLLPDIPEEDVRRAACRAQNLMMADMFRGCEDRLTPAAVIPCHTPAEAIEELDVAVNELGFKVPMFANLGRRPLEPVAELDPELGRYAFWVDTLAIDSPYNYDPLWQKCVELKVPVTSHAIAQGIGMRRSISNYMYNQTGHFADAGHAFAKALFFGGVTHRFPNLNFAFLECGVAWGAALICDLKERWEKRNKEAVQQFNPARIDTALLTELFDKYGGEALAGKMRSDAVTRNQSAEQLIDDFAATGIESLQDLYDLLIPNYYYGCEADDRMNATAFNTKLLPSGENLKAMFSSDMGHWDVTDMSDVLAEAYELVDDEIISTDDFRDFVFTNPVKLLAGMNPDFFQGTVVEEQVAGMLHDGPAA